MFWSGIEHLISTWLAPLESWARGAEGCTLFTAWWTLTIPGAWKQLYVWTSYQTAIDSLDFPIIWRRGTRFLLFNIYLHEGTGERTKSQLLLGENKPTYCKWSTYFKAFPVSDSQANYSTLLLPQTCSEIWDWICLSMPAVDVTIQKSKHWLKASLFHSAVHFRGSLCAWFALTKSYWWTSKKTPHFLGTPKCRGMEASGNSFPTSAGCQHLLSVISSMS